MHFKDKTVWITGASSGIGEALAYEFARQGARLVLSARNEEALKRVAAACEGETIVQPLDLSDYASLPGSVEKVLDRVSRVDLLINNGGISQRSPLRDTLFEVDKKLIEVNLLGTIALSKALLPHFLKRKAGHYVVITSVMGKFGAPMRSGYAASKHGLHGFFDTLRAECWRENVQVTLVTPGYVRTNISINALTADGSVQGTMDDTINRGIDPALLAKKIVRDVWKGKREVAYAAPREMLALYLKRFFPGILARLVERAKTT